MAISTYFQDAVDLVDASAVLSFVVDPTYDDFEYSWSGLEIRGGSETACEIGAAAYLEAQGFRFYTPQPDFWKLPASISQVLTQSKTENWISNTQTFLVYGHSWAGSNAQSRYDLNDAYWKWASLVGVLKSGFPAGHRWKNVIENSTAFFDAHPNLIRLTVKGEETFALEEIVDTSDWDLLAEYCAAFLLDAGLNEFNRTHFDPIDGNDHGSDLVYPFSKRVGEFMRAGTDAIGTFAAQAGVPDAQIGVYAYGAHRLPPSDPYGPEVYTQITLAFNRSGLTYEELIEQHGTLAGAVALREYLDTEAWHHGYPAANTRNKIGYLDVYDTYQPYGVREVRSEFTAHWLVNMVQARAHVVKFRTGTVDWNGIIDEIAADIFDNDPAIVDIYRLWTGPVEQYNKFSLLAAFEIVDGMVDGWYKEHFKRLMTIHWQYYRLKKPAEYGIVRNPGQPDDTFGAELSKLLTWVTGVRDDDIVHSYAVIRQEANGAIVDYPALRFEAEPEPDWFANSARPTENDWLAAFADISADADRNALLSGDDLVLMDVTPLAYAHLPPATAFASQSGLTRYVVVGPSQVTVTHIVEGDAEVFDFGPGWHELTPPAVSRITWEGGTVFMDTFPSVRKDPDGTGQAHWLFVPTVSAGVVDFTAVSRWRFYDADGMKNVTPSQEYPDLGPGQVCVDNANTIGVGYNGNANRYLSPIPTTVLLPRGLAESEGRRSMIRIIAS